jgi:hypothetical protein
MLIERFGTSMNNSDITGIKSYISSYVKGGNIASILDYIEAELNSMLSDISESSDNSDYYIDQIKQILSTPPPFTEHQENQVIDIIFPIFITHILACEKN